MEDIYPRWFRKVKGKESLPELPKGSPYPTLFIGLVLALLAVLFCANLWHWFSIEVLGSPYIAEGEELVWLNQYAKATKEATLYARAEKQAAASLQNALITFLLTVPLIITIIRIKAAHKR